MCRAPAKPAASGSELPLVPRLPQAKWLLSPGRSHPKRIQYSMSLVTKPLSLLSLLALWPQELVKLSQAWLQPKEWAK